MKRLRMRHLSSSSEESMPVLTPNNSVAGGSVAVDTSVAVDDLDSNGGNVAVDNSTDVNTDVLDNMDKTRKSSLSSDNSIKQFDIIRLSKKTYIIIIYYYTNRYHNEINFSK